MGEILAFRRTQAHAARALLTGRAVPVSRGRAGAEGRPWRSVAPAEDAWWWLLRGAPGYCSALSLAASRLWAECITVALFADGSALYHSRPETARGVWQVTLDLPALLPHQATWMLVYDRDQERWRLLTRARSGSLWRDVSLPSGSPPRSAETSRSRTHAR